MLPKATSRADGLASAPVNAARERPAKIDRSIAEHALERSDAVFRIELSLLQRSSRLLFERRQISTSPECFELGVQSSMLALQIVEARDLSLCHASLTFPYPSYTTTAAREGGLAGYARPFRCRSRVVVRRRATRRARLELFQTTRVFFQGRQCVSQRAAAALFVSPLPGPSAIAGVDEHALAH
jgi:hypothetical protein